MLLHVIDVSNQEYEEQAAVVRALIEELGASKTPCIEVYNKSDALIAQELAPRGENRISVSAKTGEGTDRLIERIAEILGRGRKKVELRIPYSDARLTELLHREAEVVSLEYREDCIYAEAIIKPELWGRVRAYVPEAAEEAENG